MNLGDFGQRVKEFWQEFQREKAGLIGLGIIAFSLIVVLLEPVFLPFQDTNKAWRDIDYWQDWPAAVPPVWTAYFSSQKPTRNAQLTDFSEAVVQTPEFGTTKAYTFTYDYQYDLPPSDVIFKVDVNNTASFIIQVVRPDGKEISLERYQKFNTSNETVRLTVQADGLSVAKNFARQFGATTGRVRPTEVFFSKAGRTMLQKREPLNGEYQFRFLVPEQVFSDAQNAFLNPHIIISGRVSGLLGTDIQKRDIFSGIIAGLKWALFIGIITSMISVLIGVLYGIISAYFGGLTDTVLSFIFEIFVSIPILPILIVVSAVFKPSIWIIVMSLIVFSWVGSVKTVRSMALQIKEETYIEAARALGGSKWRIIFKHMMPLLLPYSFASMALSVPSAIVFEASLSLLGLGDPSIVTWGQILHDAQSSGATLNGFWWWVVPPGLFIAVMGMNFAFLGFAMDKILHPKLRTR